MFTRILSWSIPGWTLLFSLLVACTSVDTSVKVTQRGWILELPEKERVAVRTLLRSKQFDDLDRRYQALQRQYERGQINDRSLTLEYQGFYDTSPENEPSLNEWVEANPTSYPARLARGIYYREVGGAKRGGRSAKETPPDNMAQMIHYLSLAEDDLTTSLSLTPKPMVSLVHLVRSSQLLGNRSKRQDWLQYADRIDPQNYGVRRAYMLSITPRWGGSYEEMWQFLTWCKEHNVPNDYLRVFESIIHLDQAKSFAELKQAEKAVQSYRKALSLLDGIDTTERLNALKGIAQADRGNLRDYMKEVDEALRLAPKDRVMLGYRGYLLLTHGNPQEGLKAFMQGAELGDPYSQLQLGRQLYYGVPSVLGSNQEEAVRWATRAAEQGYEPAKQFLNEVAVHRSRPK